MWGGDGAGQDGGETAEAPSRAEEATERRRAEPCLGLCRAWGEPCSWAQHRAARSGQRQDSNPVIGSNVAQLRRR